GTVCVVGKMRDLILQLSKSSIYSTKPFITIKRGNRVIILTRPDIALLKKALARAIFFFSL
ncbi:hypothetical protein ACR2XU_08305, partial [Klebsiella pneumoniae]